jgi:hypothetical protein
MNGWREQILVHFQPQTSRLTLVADPDALLLEEGILNAIRERGFEVLAFDDPVAFRFGYEAQYRQKWDQGSETELVVVVRGEDESVRKLPYDLLQAGRRLPTFRLADLFPKLSNPVVQALDRTYLDALYAAYQEYDGGELGDRGAKSFILKHVFGCDPELVKNRSELVRLLLEKHSRKGRSPAQLDEYLVERLRRNASFADVPLERIVPDREVFLRLLQEQWPAFLEACAAGGALPSALVPFQDLRVYIDTLFLDGDLRPVPFEQPASLPDWVRIGVVVDPVASSTRRLAGLVEQLEASVPGGEAVYKEWQHFAWRWAELLVLANSIRAELKTQLASRINALHDKVEQVFADWMLLRFATLANLVERDGRPVMVSHIPRYLASHRGESGGRIALVVVDGLAIDQWLLLREKLLGTAPHLRMDEHAVFAWVPTLTSVSRQSIFAGAVPLLFADSTGTTAKEESHWRRVWEELGVPPGAIGYRRSLGSDPSEIDEVAGQRKVQVLGLVINTVDEIMHGTVLGTAAMHQNVQLWADGGYLAQLVDRLLSTGYAVYLTADHGNVEATGQGRPSEGCLVETRGERARVYENDVFRNQVRRDFPDTLVWPSPGLPAGQKVLVAAGRTAFVPPNERVVTHGGIALEEVLVPFVRFWRE